VFDLQPRAGGQEVVPLEVAVVVVTAVVVAVVVVVVVAPITCLEVSDAVGGGGAVMRDAV